ncbi:MAG: hypothetical protein LBI04_03610, partial [Treponema sp.]|nr:hypothetical protein [Treponema sp.]
MSFSHKNAKFTAFFAVFAAFFSLFVSCSSSKPEIPYGFINLVMYEEESGHKEYFSFFVIAEDEDGIENLEELYLYNDKEQLRWKINSDEWISLTQDNRTWIGSRSITMQEGALPRGVYRAVLVNKGGERGERFFTYDADVRHPFPQIEIESGMYTIKSEWPSNRLVCYDRAGNYISTVELPSLSGSVSRLNLPSAVRTVALWTEDPAY